MMRETVRNATLLKRTYDAIADLWRERQIGPSYREIAARAGYASTATAYEHVRALKGQGFVDNNESIPRSIRIIKPWPAESTGEVA